MSKCVFCFIYYNCIIILLSVIVFVCHDKGNVFLYNKFTSICKLETSNMFLCLGVVVILLLNVMEVFSVDGGALLDTRCMVFKRMFVLYM